MTTTLISKEGFTSVKEVSIWVNDLVGKILPENPNFTIKRVIQFQLIENGDTYDIVLLSEIERRQSMSSMVMAMRKDLNLASEGG